MIGWGQPRYKWIQWCRFMLSIGGISCNFTPNLPYFQHWGDEARRLLFSRMQIKWRPKIKVFTENWKVLVPEIKWRPQKSQRSSSAQMQTIIKLLGGMLTNYWVDISPILPGFRYPWVNHKPSKIFPCEWWSIKHSLFVVNFSKNCNTLKF